MPEPPQTLDSVNLGYAEEMLELYLRDPSAVPDDWPSGLFTCTVQEPASLPSLNW